MPIFSTGWSCWPLTVPRVEKNDSARVWSVGPVRKNQLRPFSVRKSAEASPFTNGTRSRSERRLAEVVTSAW